MRVGLTYDLKDDYLAQGYDTETCAEFDSIETINAIDAFLISRGCETERIGNIHSLVPALAAGKRWDIVFNIAEGMYGRGREAQVPALLDAYRIPYVFSDPLVLSLTLDKALTKRVVRDAGIATAEFFVAEKGATHTPPAEAYPLFVKPVAEGTGKGITARSLVHNAQELYAATRDIHQRFRQDAIVEHYLAGREFTVGITGTGNHARVIGVMEILLLASADPQGYTYDNKQQYEERVRYRLVDDGEAQAAAGVAIGAWNVLGCRDGGRIDIRSDAQGQPQFLEVNPLAGLHPVLGDLVILAGLARLSYTDLMQRIFDSALSDASRFPVHPQPRITAYA
jgi:D-alanine-D-alanine ligase